MATNKVIYLNEDSESIGEEEHSETQFQDNSQFDSELNNGTKNVSVSNSIPGESNYGIEGGKQSGGNKVELEEDLDENENLEKLNLMNSKSKSNLQLGGDNEDEDGEDYSEDEDDLKSEMSEMSENSHLSSTSSLSTSAILEMDPMYIRLTKFLQTGGDNNKNLADILNDISNNFEKLNTNLENLTNKMTKMSLQQ